MTDAMKLERPRKKRGIEKCPAIKGGKRNVAVEKLVARSYLTICRPELICITLDKGSFSS
jgi:hypothetical protein